MDPKKYRVENATLELVQALVPNEILGVTDVSGDLTFLVRFENENKPMPAPATFMNDNYAHMVIAFYRSQLAFKE